MAVEETWTPTGARIAKRVRIQRKADSSPASPPAKRGQCGAEGEASSRLRKEASRTSNVLDSAVGLRTEADLFRAAIGGTERDRTQPTLQELELRPPPPLILSLRYLIAQIEAAAEKRQTG
jgi:hypothetical protein